MPSRGEQILHVQDVHKKFGDVAALTGVSCTLRRGDLTALLGPNGSGKTTLIRAILGLHSADSGRIDVFGHLPGSYAAKIRIGAMLQAAAPPEALTVEELIGLFRSYYPRPLPLGEILHSADLEVLRRRRYERLSGGEKRRVQFSIAICGDPDIVLLDEPTVHMDMHSRQTFWRTVQELRAREKSVVLVTHQIDEVDSLADRVLLMSRGAIVKDASVAALRGSFTLSKISCITSLSAEQITQFVGVCAVSSRGRKIEILTGERDEVVRRLVQADGSLSELLVEQAPLEDAIEALLNATRQEVDP